MLALLKTLKIMKKGSYINCTLSDISNVLGVSEKILSTTLIRYELKRQINKVFDVTIIPGNKLKLKCVGTSDILKELKVYTTTEDAINEYIANAPADVNKVKNKASTHYELWKGTEAIDVIKQMLTEEEYKGFLKGNILKYQLRTGKKDDVSKEIEKIKDYSNELKEL